MERPALTPLPSAPVARAAIVRLRDGATLGARVSPRVYASARWLRCQLLTEPQVVLYVAVETVAWLAWVSDARARAVAARHGAGFVDLAPSAPPARPAAPADPSTAPPPPEVFAEVLDEDILEPLEAEPSPRVWLALRRSTTGDRAVAPAEWASEHGAILPEVRTGCVVFQVVAAGEGRVRAAADAAGLSFADCCARCGWTAEVGGERTLAAGVCSACSAGEGEP